MGSIFKTKFGKGTAEKGGAYKPGEPCFDQALVNDIVERCENIHPRFDDDTVAFIERIVPGQLDSVEHFDQDAFLEALVMKWQQNIGYSTLGHLLTTCIRTLYREGIDSFTIDIRAVPKRLYIPASRIKGTEERPLKVRCLGEVTFFGLGVEHCHLDLEGYCQSAGEGAKSSVFRFSCPGEEMDIVALGAEDSAFYNVPSLKPTPFYRRDGGEGCIEPVSKRCRFHVEDVEQRLLWTIEENGFWRHENRLYVPDGDGGWNERIPDGEGNWKEVPG